MKLTNSFREERGSGDAVFLITFFFIIAALSIAIGTSLRNSYDRVGSRAHTNAIVYCIEDPIKCKIEYNYIKLKTSNSK